jgi:hypothetical protein
VDKIIELSSIASYLHCILFRSQACDNAKIAELLQIEQKGVMRKRWNGVGEREKLSAQRIYFTMTPTRHTRKSGTEQWEWDWMSPTPTKVVYTRVKAFEKCGDGSVAGGPAKDRRTRVIRVSQTDVESRRPERTTLG